MLSDSITHHHDDHTKGVVDILQKYSIPVYSSNSNIKGTTNIVKDGSIINLSFINIDVISTPGHTLDHVIFYNKDNNILFSGDTLFRLGCGRVFEGTNYQMYESLQKIFSLDDKTHLLNLLALLNPRQSSELYRKNHF